MKSKFANNLLRWYGSRERRLPWRKNPRPYAVWVAEIMAQQTRLESMLPYYRRWMHRFPTIKSLARSKEQDVLKLWEGLGYYSRARNLRKAAQIVKEEFGGRLPTTAIEIRKLPGIGPYTAGAIASLAFGADEAAVDGNAVRVLARYFNVGLSPVTTMGRRRFWQLARQNLPTGKAAAYNQALMDLGAQVCAPRNPQCEICPLAQGCRAKAIGNQRSRPVKLKIGTIPLRMFAAAVVRQNGKVLISKRSDSGLLAGMWEFPNNALPSLQKAEAQLRKALSKDFGFNVSVVEKRGTFEHAYSHFRARMQVFDCPLNGHRPKVNSTRAKRWIRPRDLASVPMGKLDRRIANSLLAEEPA
ncbi:MAG TPA: A/G-specific adenine glycosylase [Terriglobales bacterium]|nr:A/G-specific adenine glycosylase [Terriglobales bacterium]